MLALGLASSSSYHKTCTLTIGQERREDERGSEIETDVSSELVIMDPNHVSYD